MFFDQLTAFFGNIDRLKSWARNVTAANIATVGLDRAEPILLRTYLRRVRGSDTLSKVAAFHDLGGAAVWRCTS